MKAALLAFVLLVPVFAGCLAKTVVVTTTVDLVEQRFSPGAFPEGTGGLKGITLNENGAFVPGVHLTILDQPYYVRSDAKGRFNFAGAIPAGTYLLRWDHPDYVSSEKPILVKENEAADTEVVLRALGGASGDHIQHKHDLWEGKTELPLFNDKVRVPPGPIETQDTTRGYSICAGVGVSSGGQACHLAAFRLPPGKLVPPGTKELKVKITWTPQDYVKEVTLLYTPADQTYAREVKEIKHGDTVKVPLTPANADHGHQVRSLWSFALLMKVTVNGQPGGGLHTEPTNKLMSPEATVVMSATKSDEDLPPEAAHPRYWANGSKILLIKDRHGINSTANRDPQAPIGSTTCNAYYHLCRIIMVKKNLIHTTIVPPGTTRLRITFEWGEVNDQLAPLAKAKKLLVRKGNVDPYLATWSDYVTPDVVKTVGRNITYELKLKPGETDPFYQKKSGFVFTFAKEGEERERSYTADCPQGCGGDRFYLWVEAVNDNWTEDLAKAPDEDE